VVAGRQEVERRGEGLWLIAIEWANAVLSNRLGRYSDALAASEQAGTDPARARGIDVGSHRIHRGRRARGCVGARQRPLRRLGDISQASGTDWALGGEAARERLSVRVKRPSAFIGRRSSGSAAPASGSLSRARTSLRRVAAPAGPAGRGAGAAHRAPDLRDIGTEGFAERARRELVSTGERRPSRCVGVLVAAGCLLGA
jgi:hypothetical protein